MGKLEKISTLQYWILVNSIIYYELSENVVSDKMFDANSAQLIKYKARWPKSYTKSRWNEVFKDFDGNTGFDLFSKLTKAQKEHMLYVARSVINQCKRGWR